LDVHPYDDELIARIEETLASYLDLRRQDAVEIEPAFGDAIEALKTFVLGGGKRIRPTFAWWGWRGAGGEPTDEMAPAVLRAVSSMELLQACALVHDDLMDASTTRRGRPTVHLQFSSRHVASGWNGTPDRFGTAAAILLGDLALAWADDMMRAAGLPASALLRIREPWEAMRTEMVGGQYLDMLAQATGDASVRAALRIDRYKTAAYTVERPLHLGAAIIKADQALIGAYRRFGIDIGIAFQLRDDLLGIFGDPKVTGKPVGDDLREGKRTLLVATALERARERGAGAAERALTSALGNHDLEAGAVDRIRDLLLELGAVWAVEQRIATLTDAALEALKVVEITEPAASRLAELAVSVAQRQR
jgi:geranylgeranyl diphosphate synthase type I